MNQELLIKVIGFLTTAVVGILIWVLVGALEAQQATEKEFDLFKSGMEARVYQIEGEVEALWDNHNKYQDVRIQDIKDLGDYKEGISCRMTEVEVNQKHILNEKN